MQKSCSADKSTMYVDNIRQSSERMREMLNTLLDSFRLDNGKEQPNLSPCRISAITHILETEFMPIAMNKGLTLIVESHTDAVVLTDKERILQIGNNLLSNAIKFTDNGSVSLAADYDNGLLKLIVEDTGTGMTEDEQQRVFGAFERLSNAAAKDGFGLGLSIVQRIVAMLGGTIRLESEKGKGSRFTVEIPMQTAEELPEQTIQAQMRHNHICHDVIAIDNDEVLLLMLKEMYAHEGMHCDTCTNVSVLMELIRKKEYSLLLTDLNMPEISGFELLELLRSSNVGNSKSIPIVVTTASGSCSKEELIGRGFAGCLFKPFSISELMEITDKCALSSILDEKPDFSTLLSYGNESVMLDKLIAETEKEMQAVKDAEQRKDLQELDTLTHHLRSSWQILRADQPLRELYAQLHGSATPDDEAICKKAVIEKRFRQDLLYRLHDFEITVPPLRDCQEDIMPLAEFFREIANNELECSVTGLDAEARKTLLTHPWPGNVRELRQKIMGAVLQAQTGVVMKEHLELAVTKPTSPVSFALRNDAEDKERILRALKQANGNRKVAAELLGIGRTTLYSKLEEYGLKYKFQQS